MSACARVQVVFSHHFCRILFSRCFHSVFKVFLIVRAVVYLYGLGHAMRAASLSEQNALFRVAPVRFGCSSGWNVSSGSSFRFRRFLSEKGFTVFEYSLTGKDGSCSGFGSWKMVPAVPFPLSVSGETVPTVPVSGSGEVPEPPCLLDGYIYIYRVFP